MTDENVWMQEADAILREVDTDFETADLPLPEKIALAQAWGTVAVAEELNRLRQSGWHAGDAITRAIQDTTLGAGRGV